MSTYIKHVTQLSTDGDWQLDFDLTATTPEEVFTLTENVSVLNNARNPVITYVGNSTAKLRGRVYNKIYVNNSFVVNLAITGHIKQELTNGDTTLSNYLPIGFNYIGEQVIQHDTDGIGIANIHYIVTFTEDTMYATHTKIEFICNVQLNKIIVSNVPFTEMGSVTKDAIANGSVAIRTRLVVNNGNQNISTFGLTRSINEPMVLTEEDAIKNWELNDERYVPNTGFVGQFVARTLHGELHNISDDFSIEDTDIELQIGVVQLGTRYQLLSTEDGRVLLDENGNKIYLKDLGSDITTWYSLGNFLITKPEDDEVADNTKFEAFDYTIKFNADFNADYIDSTYTESFNTILKNNGSVTLHWLASYTCAQVGVIFANETFANCTMAITSNQFTQGESCRDVMKSIAEVAFGWCRIGWDNKCYIDEPQTISTADDNSNILTNDNYYSLTTQKQVYGPINRVVIGMSAITGQESIVEDLDSINNFGKTEILIMDNPILYTPELREFAKESATKLLGLYYSPIEMETPGHPWLLGNELIDVQDMEGNSRYTYPFNRTLTYTGHIKSKVVSPADTAQEKDNEYKQQLFKTVKDIGIKVDAQEGKINTINASVEATKDGLSSIERRFETEITDTYSKTQIQEIINGTAEDGTVVSSVTTTAGTFDKNGLTIEQSGSLTKTNINSNGMIIYNTSGTSVNDELLNVNSEGVDAKNIKVSKYLNIGSHSRMEDYTHTDYKQGTGVFWIGSD